MLIRGKFWRWSRYPVSALRLSLKSPEGVDNRMLNESVYNEF